MNRKVKILGDIHGETNIINKWLYRGHLDDTDLYQIGDWGMGFGRLVVMENTLESLDTRLGEHNCKLFIIRGNHDDPSFWCNDDKRTHFNKTYANIELIPDFTTKIIRGEKVLFFGGGVSIDRKPRKEEELKWAFRGVYEKSYWDAEGVQEPPDDLGEHDVIIAHNAPSFFNYPTSMKHLKWWCDNDSELFDDLVAERERIDRIFMKTLPTMYYSGHFHNSKTDNHLMCDYRCIDINEFVDFD